MFHEQTPHPAPLENALAGDFDASALLRFAFPTVFMMIFFGLYTVVDTIFVARGVNTDALSAINIVTPVVNIIVGLATMLGAGGSAIVARKMGSGKNSEARRDFTLICIAGAATGILYMIAGLMFLDPLLRALGANDALLPYCRDYLGVLLVFTPVNMLQVVFASLFITAGRPGLGMKLGVAAGIANALLDYLFIFGFSMGIKGAALATGIGYAIPAIAGMVFFFRNTQGTLFFCRPKFDLRVLGESTYNGSSEMVGQLSAAVTTFLFNAVMMTLAGENGVASITIMIYLQFLLSAFFIGFAMGISPVISYNYGSRNDRQLKRLVRSSSGVILIVSILVSVLTWLFGGVLVGIFTPQGSPVYTIAREGFFIFPFAFLFAGFNIFASALFTALSNGTLSGILAFSRCALIALGIIALPRFIGVNGVWAAAPLAEFIVLGLGVYLFWGNRAKFRYA